MKKNLPLNLISKMKYNKQDIINEIIAWLMVVLLILTLIHLI
jgi:hypothetical protein